MPNQKEDPMLRIRRIAGGCPLNNDVGAATLYVDRDFFRSIVRGLAASPDKVGSVKMRNGLIVRFFDVFDKDGNHVA